MNAWIEQNLVLIFLIVGFAAYFAINAAPREQHRQVIANDAVVESIYQCLECVK